MGKVFLKGFRIVKICSRMEYIFVIFDRVKSFFLVFLIDFFVIDMNIIGVDWLKVVFFMSFIRCYC